MKFRMVDRIVEFEPGRRIRGVKSVSFEEYQLPSALAGDAHLPRSLAMESLVQLGRWLVVLSSEFTRTAHVAEIHATRFFDVARPAERLVIEATVQADDTHEVIFDGKAMIADRLGVEMVGCRLTKTVLTDDYDPDDLRVLFSEIHRPEAEPRP
jgi:3-hydroxyacyl-[acyl-carrier-protein] dehydratase